MKMVKKRCFNTRNDVTVFSFILKENESGDKNEINFDRKRNDYFIQ